MKILAFSDVIRWNSYEDLVREVKPDLIVLAGDLTSDGFASFWSEAVQQIPAFQKELQEIGIVVKRVSNVTHVSCTKNQPYDQWHLQYDLLVNKYKNSKEFLEIRKKIHVDKFYEFLQYAGSKTTVLVVKGDHDEDFVDDYDFKKINQIPGCKEISGSVVEIHDIRFLGLGFKETHNLKTLNPLVEKLKGKVDVVITHCENKNLPIVSLLKPSLIVRGHYGAGKYLVNDIPTVLTQGAKYTIIEIGEKELPKILQYVESRDGKTELLGKGFVKPWFSTASEFELYDWLKPYPKD